MRARGALAHDGQVAVVECEGPADVNEAARWVRDRAAQEGKSIDPRAARLVAERTGPDIGRLRSDVERLVLYAGGNKAITEADVKEVVGAATSQDDWGVTRAIERGSAGDALRELAMLIPLIAVIIWLGVYPAPVLRRMENSSQLLLDRVQGTGAVASGGEPGR